MTLKTITCDRCGKEFNYLYNRGCTLLKYDVTVIPQFHSAIAYHLCKKCEDAFFDFRHGIATPKISKEE